MLPFFSHCIAQSFINSKGLFGVEIERSIVVIHSFNINPNLSLNLIVEMEKV